jgi:hypothetical protein
VHFLFFKYFIVSHHIPVPTLYVYNFARFLVFLAIFQVLPSAFLIFHVFSFSRHIRGPIVCVSHFPYFKVISPYPGPTVYISHF